MDSIPGTALRSARVAVLLAALAGFGLAAEVRAGCADPRWSGTNPDSAILAPAVYHPDGVRSGDVIRVGNFAAPAGIVGLWKFEMISKSTRNNTNPMPDGTLIDFGTAAWHADGTELQTSGIRHPSDGNVCQGVWEQVDHATFVLNHYALAWTNGNYTGPVNIRARVTVDPTGQRYSGQFVTVVYLASVTPGHEFDENTALATITGTFTATRVTVP